MLLAVVNLEFGWLWPRNQQQKSKQIHGIHPSKAIEINWKCPNVPEAAAIPVVHSAGLMVDQSVRLKYNFLLCYLYTSIGITFCRCSRPISWI